MEEDQQRARAPARPSGSVEPGRQVARPSRSRTAPIGWSPPVEPRCCAQDLAALGDRQRLGAGARGPAAAAGASAGRRGRGSARRRTTGRPASAAGPLRQARRREVAARARCRRAASTALPRSACRQPSRRVETPRSRRVHRSGATLADMTLDSRRPTAVAARGDGVPEETFDVEPPYVPDARGAGRASRSTTTGSSTASCPGCASTSGCSSWPRTTTLPLLERVRFLAIFASNLDEFFMVRVAGLKRRIAAGRRRAGGLRADAARGARGDLDAQPRELMPSGTRGCSATSSCPRCANAGIELVRWDDLDREEQKFCKRLFKDRVFPVLTPLAVDPAHPFPYISGLSLNLAVLVRNPKTGKEHFARVKVPPIFGRFVPLGQPALRAARGRHRRAPQAALPRHGGAARCTPSGSPATRTSRSRRTTPRTCSPALEKELLRRRFGPPVRLEVEESIDPAACSSCWSPSSASRPRRSFRLPGPLDLRGLHDIADLTARGPEVPRVRADHPPAAGRGRVVRRRSTCSRRPGATTCCCTTPTTRSRPRCSGSSSRPPPTRTCSRSSRRSTAPPATRPIIDALIDAAEAGKQVLVLVEIKARFDEAGQHPLGPQARAGRLPRRLRPGRPEDPLQAGDGGARRARRHPPLHPHRHRQLQPEDRADRTRTSACSPPTSAIGEDVAHLFNNLSGYVAQRRRTTQLLVAPDSVRDGLVERIHREIDAPPGRPPGADPDQGQLHRRRGASSTRSTSPRRQGVPVAAAGARHLRAAARRARAVGDHRGALDPRAGSSSTAGSSGSRTAASPRPGSARPT